MLLIFQSPEFNGFLWDESKQISLRSSSILQKVNKSKPFVRQPFIGYFKVRVKSYFVGNHLLLLESTFIDP